MTFRGSFLGRAIILRYYLIAELRANLRGEEPPLAGEQGGGSSELGDNTPGVTEPDEYSKCDALSFLEEK
jgi:hypothetical protein